MDNKNLSSAINGRKQLETMKMNANIKETVNALLSSYNNGRGKTSELIGKWQWNSSTQLHVDGLGDFEIPEVVQRAVLLQTFAANSKAEPKGLLEYKRTLEAYASGFLGTFHQKSSKDSKESNVSNPLEKERLQTPEEYRSSIFRGNMLRENGSITEELILSYLSLDDKKKTRDSLDKILEKLSIVFYPEEKREYYSTMVEEREKLAKEFAKLVTLGIKDIRKTDKSKILGNISLKDADKSLAKLEESGYKLEQSSFNAADMLLNLTLSVSSEKDNSEKLA